MKNMKKRLAAMRPFFSGRLWLYGLTRVRLPAVCIGAGLLLLSVILTGASGRPQFRHGNVRALAVNSLTPALVLVPFVSVVILYLCFSFLHSRRQSDAVSAMPYSRACLYLSLLGSVLTVTAGLTLITALPPLISAAAGGAWFLVGEVFLHMLLCFLTSLYALSVMLLLILWTGRGWLPFLLFGPAVSLPRLFLSALGTALSGKYVPDPTGFLSWLYPVPVAFLESALMGDNIVLSAGSMIWAVVSPLLLFAAGLLVMLRRPAETVGQAASGHAVQWFLRMIYASPAVLFFCLILPDLSVIDLSVVVVLLVIDLGLLFVYEAVSTLSGRRLWRALPAFLLLLLLLPGFKAVDVITDVVLKNETLDPGQVSAVYIDLFSPVTADDAVPDSVLRRYALSDEEVCRMTAASVGRPAGEDLNRGPAAVIWLKDGRVLHRYLYFTSAFRPADEENGRPTHAMLEEAYAQAEPSLRMTDDSPFLPRTQFITAEVDYFSTRKAESDYFTILTVRGTKLYEDLMTALEEDLTDGAEAGEAVLSLRCGIAVPVSTPEGAIPGVLTLMPEDAHTGIYRTFRASRSALPRTAAVIDDARKKALERYGTQTDYCIWRDEP